MTEIELFYFNGNLTYFTSETILMVLLYEVDALYDIFSFIISFIMLIIF